MPIGRSPPRRAPATVETRSQRAVTTQPPPSKPPSPNPSPSNPSTSKPLSPRVTSPSVSNLTPAWANKTFTQSPLTPIDPQLITLSPPTTEQPPPTNQPLLATQVAAPHPPAVAFDINLEPSCKPTQPIKASETTKSIEDKQVNSFIELVRKLTKTIINAINDGKSVTAANKKIVITAAQDICKATENINIKVPPTEKPISDTNLSTLKEDIVASVSAEITKLREEIAEITSITAPKPSYATIAAKTQKPAILITPTTTTGTEKTIDTWRSAITFKNKKYSPSNIKPVANGKILVEFDNQQQCQETIEIVNNTKSLQAEEAKRRPPLVILKGINKLLKKEELIDVISYQNSVPSEALRLCFLTSNRNPALYNAVIEVRPNIYTSLIQLERVAVDHQRVHIEPFSRFVQCSQCLQYGHTRSKCTAEVHPCAHCAAVDHQLPNCPFIAQPEKTNCYNCINYAQKTGNNNCDTKHRANSINLCPRIKTIKTRVEEATDYGY